MEASTKRAIINYVLANTKKAAFKKAAKNFNFGPLVESHKKHILQTFFQGDGVKYSNAVAVLWDEYFTQAQSEEAQKATLELKSIQKNGGTLKDEDKAEKRLANNTRGLTNLSDLYESIRNGEVDDDDDDDDDDNDDDDNINLDPDNGNVDPPAPNLEDTLRVTPSEAANVQPDNGSQDPADDKGTPPASPEPDPATPVAPAPAPGKAPKAPSAPKPPKTNPE